MTYPVDPAAYWKLLKAIFDDRPKRKRRTEYHRPVPRHDPAAPTPLVHRPTLNRAEARGRVMAMIRAADQATDRTTNESRKSSDREAGGTLTPGGLAGEALGTGDHSGTVGKETTRR